MGTIDRRIDAHVPFHLTGRVGLGDQPGMDPIPGAVETESLVPLPDRLPRPERDRQISPRDPGPEPVDDPLDHLAVVPERPRLLAD